MSELTAEEKSALSVITGDHKSPARISYAKIFKPEKNDLSGKDEYSCMVLIPKSSHQAQRRDKLLTEITIFSTAKIPGNPLLSIRNGKMLSIRIRSYLEIMSGYLSTLLLTTTRAKEFLLG